MLPDLCPKIIKSWSSEIPRIYATLIYLLQSCLGGPGCLLWQATPFPQPPGDLCSLMEQWEKKMLGGIGTNFDSPCPPQCSQELAALFPVPCGFCPCRNHNPQHNIFCLVKGDLLFLPAEKMIGSSPLNESQLH